MKKAIDSQDANNKALDIVSQNAASLNSLSSETAIAGKIPQESPHQRCRVLEQRLLQLQQENHNLALERSKLSRTCRTQVRLIEALQVKNGSIPELETATSPAINIDSLPPIEAKEFLPIPDAPEVSRGEGLVEKLYATFGFRLAY